MSKGDHVKKKLVGLSRAVQKVIVITIIVIFSTGTRKCDHWKKMQ